MFNAIWIGSGPLNSVSLPKVVEFASSVAVGVTADAVPIERQRGLASSVTARVTTAAGLVRVKTLAASRPVTVTSQATPIVTRSMLPLESNIFVSAFLGSSTPREFASAVNVTVTAELLPFDVIFDATASVTVTVPAVEINRIRTFASSVSIGVTAETLTMTRYRGFNVVVPVTVTAIGEPDRIIGGVRYADMSFNASASVTAQEQSIVTCPFRATPQVRVTVAPVAPISTNRIRRLVAGSHLVAASVAPTMLRLKKQFAANASIGVTGQVGLVVRRRFASSVSSAVSASSPRLTLAPARMRPAPAPVSVTAQATMRRTAGCASSVFPFVSASLPTLLNVANRMSPAPVFISVTASRPTMVALRRFASSVNVSVTATGDFATNIYDDEPDYRTDIVAPESFVDLVEPEDFVLYVRDDSTAMKTFTKQPNDILAYDIDFGEWFAELEGDDIESAACVIVSASAGLVTDLTLGNTLLIGSPSTKVKQWVEDGISGATYQLTLTINTEGGRRKERDFRIKVREL